MSENKNGCTEKNFRDGYTVNWNKVADRTNYPRRVDFIEKVIDKVIADVNYLNSESNVHKHNTKVLHDEVKDVQETISELDEHYDHRVHECERAIKLFYIIIVIQLLANLFFRFFEKEN